jgi:hypothetical protein
MRRKQFALVLQADAGSPTESPPIRSVDRDYIKDLVGPTWYGDDWIRFTAMGAFRGPPALMRAPKTDAVPGQPEPTDIHWFYVLLDEDAQPEMTFSRLEELYGSLRKFREKQESGQA